VKDLQQVGDVDVRFNDAAINNGKITDGWLEAPLDIATIKRGHNTASVTLSAHSKPELVTAIKEPIVAVKSSRRGRPVVGTTFRWCHGLDSNSGRGWSK